MARRRKQEVDEAVYLAPTVSQSGFGNCCPRCGQGKLMDGMLSVGKRCSNCGLDYGFADSGDGPAVFVILIIGFVVTGLAMALQSAVNPPWWVHVLLWAPITFGVSIWALRVAKAMMIAMQYQTKAREGSLEKRD